MYESILEKAHKKFLDGDSIGALNALSEIPHIKDEVEGLISQLKTSIKGYNRGLQTPDFHHQEQSKIRDEIQRLIKQGRSKQENSPLKKPTKEIQNQQDKENRTHLIQSLEAEMQMNPQYPFPDFFHRGSSKNVTLSYMKQLLACAKEIYTKLTIWQWQYKQDQNEAFSQCFRLQKWLEDFKERIIRTQHTGTDSIDIIDGTSLLIAQFLAVFPAENAVKQRKLQAKMYSLKSKLSLFIDDLQINIQIAEALK